MTNYIMPALSEQERKAQISLAEEELAHLNRCRERYSNGEMGAGFVEGIERQIINQKIVLAALTAKPYGYVHKNLYENSGCSVGLSNDHEAHQGSESHIAVFKCPPVPVKQEGEHRD